MSALGQAVWEAALGFLKTEVRHRGRKPGKALDCLGVLLCAYAASGVTITEPPRYGRDPDPEFLLAHLREWFEPVDDEQPGDVLVFGDGRGRPRHFAITDGGERIVHAEGRAGRVVLQALDGSMRATRHSCWRLRHG